MSVMDKDAVIAKLREHREELAALGLEHIALFGSVARGDQTAESDLDLLVRFSEPTLKSGFSFFSLLEDLTIRLKELTGAPDVDVVIDPIQKERVRRSVEKDLVSAF
ncbi:MAG: nucleotidyltransferase domain-containing protein [Arenimonas sp.]|nr:nucleotidyltransferase domain-containing protein [Arenimonas sp.]